LDVLVEITDGDKRVTTIFSVFKTPPWWHS
jgi:hypothetical protein